MNYVKGLVLSLLILLTSSCSMLDHSWSGWIGSGYSIGEGKDDPVLIYPEEMSPVHEDEAHGHEAANPETIRIVLPDEMQPAVEPGPDTPALPALEVEDADPRDDPNAAWYQCVEAKGLLECTQAIQPE